MIPSHVRSPTLAIVRELICNQLEPFLAAVDEQVPRCIAAEDASGLLEREEWDKDDKENGSVG